MNSTMEAQPGGGEEAEEIPATEKDQAEDAPWKKIQQNTFTRWCNEHLKCVQKWIEDLQHDLSGSLRLIALLEVLSQKKMGRKHHLRPNFRQMKLENVSVALKFLERERIKLVSIDSKAIVDGNLKLILGLIWTLILHYSISMPMWEEEEDVGWARQQSPQQRLLGWIQHKVPQLRINNFSCDWRDGRALGALVDNCAPGLCPDWENWDPQQPVQNAREAMQQADDWLGVPQVIAPEEIMDPDVDEHSVMTYLSQFPKAKLKPGTPLHPQQPQSARVRAYGPGIEPQGNVVLRPAHFTVETLEAGLGEVLVYVEDPEGHTEEAKVVPNNDKKRTYSVTYVPKVRGLHKVTVLFAGQNIDCSPFGVTVAMASGDATKVTARGPGLEPQGNVAHKVTYFDIYTAGAGPGDVGVVITDPHGRRDTVEVMLEDKGDNIFCCTYRPFLEGPHTITVTYAGTPIPRSPFTIHMAEGGVQGTCKVWGGVQGACSGCEECASGCVRYMGCARDVRGVRARHVEGVQGTCMLCKVVHKTSKTGGGRARCNPFEVTVSPPCGAAEGPGLVRGMVGHSTEFVVEATGTDVGTLGFSIEGPSQARIECEDHGDGSCDVHYRPTESGAYAVHVLYDDMDIRHSPFIAHILPAPPNSYPDKVKTFGLGLEPTSCIVERPAEFTIDTRGAGKGPLQLYAQNAEGVPIDIKVKDKGDGTYHCIYVPTKAIKHTIIVTWGGVTTPHSPFRVGVGEDSHPGRVKVYGPGVEQKGLKATEPTYFTVDCAEAGQGDVSIGIKCAPGVVGPAEADIDFDIIKNCNDTFTVKYTPLGVGLYTIMLLFANQILPSCDITGGVARCGGAGTCCPPPSVTSVSPPPPQEIPSSPFCIKVDPSHDASRVKVEGPGVSRTGVEEGQPTHFHVQMRGAGKAPLQVQFGGAGPGPAVRDFWVVNHHDYTHTVTYTPLQQGPLSVIVTYGGDPVPRSPFPVTVAPPPPQLGKVKVQGLNSKVEVGQTQEFRVEMQGAGGQGKVEVKVMGPSHRPLPCQVGPAPPGGPHPVTFTPPKEGLYKVEVTYDGHSVPGSPFPVEALLPPDPSKVVAQGPGLHGGHIGAPAPFTICTQGAGAEGLGMTVEGPCEAKVECGDNGDGTCSVTYVPTVPGDYLINILFADRHIPGSPFTARITPNFDPTKVTASGPGLEGGRVGEVALFSVDCSQAGDAELTIEILSEMGVKVEVVIQNNQDGTYAITYTPAAPGAYSITVKYGGHPVPNFPLRVLVEPAVDMANVKVYGKGVEAQGVLQEVGTEFMVDAQALTQMGGPHVQARVVSPSGATTDTHVTDHGNGTYRVEYTPYEDGVHLVEVTYDDVGVPKSPFRVGMTEGCDPRRVRAHSPGLESGILGKANRFTVETRDAGTGGLGLAIEGPSEAKMSCDSKDGSCTVEYIPFTPGDYDVNITFRGHPIPGSPFRVPVAAVVDPGKVKCLGPGLGPTMRAGLPHTFTVDCSATGLAPLEVMLLGPLGVAEPVEVRDNGDRTHKVTYTPSSDGPYILTDKFTDQEVPRSPFKVKVLPAHDASKVRASGPGLGGMGVPASLPMEFTIDAQEAGEGLLTVQILDPEGHPTKALIRDNGDGTYGVRYIPALAGPYTGTMRYGGDEIPSSPFHLLALPTGDASKCLVTVSIGGHGLGACLGPTIQIGEETVITVDAKAAGQGKVTCKVSTPDGAELDMDVVENHDGTFDIFYTAPEPGKYVITIRFGGENVPNSPFHVLAMEEPPLTIETLRPFNLVIPFTMQKGKITGEVRMLARPNITDNKDGTVTVRYAPTEKGLHEMDIHYDSNHIPGSPLQFYVDTIKPRHVSAYGPGLSHSMVNKPCTFTIVTKDSGEGGLSLAVEGPSKAEITCQDNKDGTCAVSYLPTAPGDYSIIVRFDDKHVPGSPFTAKITGDDSMRTSQLNVGTLTDVSLKITETDLSLLTASIRAPSGNEEPCLLKRLPNYHIGISFTPKEVGEHMVSMRKSGQHVTNSPFKILVGQSEIGDASRVKVWGKGLVGHTFDVAEFIVNTCSAGYGGLGLSIKGPSKVDINCEDVEDGTCKVTYCPTEPGNYIINIKFADKPVPGSPFTVKVTGEGRMKESIMCQRQAPSIATIGSTCDLNLKIPAVAEGTEMVTVNQPASFTVQLNGARRVIDAKVHMPAGVVEECYVSELDSDKFSIGFLLRENGVHSIDLHFNGRHVPGSPFNVRVGEQSQAGDPGLVTAYGPGLEGGLTGVCLEFLVKTANAGAGALAVTIDGPSKVKLDCVECPEGHRVTYTPMAPGNYLISIKYGGPHHIVGSPFKAKVTGPRLSGGHSLHETSTVMVETVMREGMAAVASLQGPPAFGGLPKFSSNAGKVVAWGPGLATAFLGQKNHFTVDCSKAGTNMLLVGVHGPKSPCEEVYVKHLGNRLYNVTYTVKDKGDYVLILRWGDDNIPGSPFRVTVP
ncbi:LOW QUALITY PROTEIN: filamin-C-like [Podargus strigoides]